MKRIIPCLLVSFLLVQVSTKAQKKVSTYLFAQYNNTVYYASKGNNPWGIGAGMQIFFNNKTKFKPTIEFTADTYLKNDKVFRLEANGKPIDDLGSIANLFVGSSFHPTEKIYFSLIAGPSFVNGNTYFGLKPSFDFYFSNNQRWTGKLSFINIFNRDELTKEDFG